MINILYFAKSYTRFRNCRLRAIMRSHKKVENLKRCRDIRDGFVDAAFSAMLTSAPKIIFSASEADAEILVRQLIIQRLQANKFTDQVLYQLGIGRAQTYAMPKDFRTVLHKHGIETNQIRSVVAWSWFVGKYWLHGLATGMKLLFIGLKNSFQPTNQINLPFAHFLGLSLLNLPSPERRSFQILTWYRNWPGRNPHLETIAHDVFGAPNSSDGIFYLAAPFWQLKGLRQLWLFSVWYFKAACLSTFLALQGKWWSAFVFSEAVKAKAFTLIPLDKQAAEYLFHFSTSVYRPMWTYEAIKRGAKVTSYFYSTSEQIRLPGEQVSQRYEWGAANWPTYLVWDDYQATVMKRDVGRGEVQVVGPIYFSSSNEILPELPNNIIAIFDVQPHRRLLHFGTSTLADYLVLFPDAQYRFLNDIHEILAGIGIHIAIKPKRAIGRLGVKRYNRLLFDLSQKQTAILVSPNVAAISLIERCNGAISFPFTSTALYAKAAGKPSVYYDPTSWISRDDPGAHGIQILHGPEELRLWALSIIIDK